MPTAMVYMGTYNSGTAKISIPITNEARDGPDFLRQHLPGLTKAIDGVTEEGEPDIYYPTGKRNYMRICPADDIQGGAAANWAYGEMARARPTSFMTTAVRQRRGEGLRAQFKELGGEVLGFEGSIRRRPITSR